MRFALTGCTVLKPEGKGCKVDGSAITTNFLAAKVKSPTEVIPTLEMTNLPLSSEIGTFSISGCSIGALNHAYTITGKLFARAQMNAGKTVGAWSVPAALNENNSLFISEQKATATGEVTVKSGGKVVTMG